MRYEDLIATVSEIVENENIYKPGLVVLYELKEELHRKMDEHLFYKANPSNTEFVHRDVVEVEIGGVIVRFVKKDLVD
jgi:hypothetical protein